MKRTLSVIALVLTFGLASLDADAQARRFGGGRNLGKQRPAPMEAQKAPAQTPASPPASQSAAPAKPGAAPAAAGAAAPKPSFMQRWGGLLAGLGIGALLASMFGAQLGPIIGMLLMILLGVAVVALLFKLFSRKQPPGARPAMAGAAPGASPQFRGIGSAIPGGASASEPVAATRTSHIDPAALAPGEVEGFVRVAKTSFIRLQAANDARDLNDIRDYTTPEMYAELAMQMQDRGDVPQRTEVVNLNAQVVEAVVEGDQAIASVRFTGLMRENDAANPSPFDELWHVRKNLRERNGAWLVAGIQQLE